MKIRPSIVALVWIRRLRGILDVTGYKYEPADIVLFVHPDDIFVVFNPALSFWIGGHQKILLMNSASAVFSLPAHRAS